MVASARPPTKLASSISRAFGCWPIGANTHINKPLFGKGGRRGGCVWVCVSVWAGGGGRLYVCVGGRGGRYSAVCAYELVCVSVCVCGGVVC